jgi:hypothetical protein
VPLSNFVSDENKGVPQPAQANVPARFSEFSGLEPGISVPWHRSTLYWVGDSVACQSLSDFWTSISSVFFTVMENCSAYSDACRPTPVSAGLPSIMTFRAGGVNRRGQAGPFQRQSKP